MERFPLGGLLLWIAILAVGLVWTGPLAGRQPVAADSEPPFRIHGPGTGHIVEVDLDAVETVQEIAPGIDYRVWTFGGTVPGPVIRVTQGDTVRFTLTNKSTAALSHSIDFHAAQTPWDVNYQPVAPGETLTFDWVARFPGVFMYHCGVPPVLHHIANGMYGAIIVEPADPLPPAREYVLVSSELYPGPDPVKGAFEGGVERMETVRPEYVVFNGVANLHLDAPLEARPNELIRLWVMNAGPTVTNAFHVIGALFDHVYPDGNPTTPMNGIQTWNVPPGGGAMFELKIPDAGLYPFVSHAFAYTGLGSVGVIKVDESVSPAPASYPAMADPFDGGLTETVGTVEGVAEPATPASDGEEDGEPAEDHGAITVEAVITGFSPDALEVKEGEVTITLVNGDPMPHDFTIDELGVQEAVGPEETATFSFDAEPGAYTFYCSIPGHRESGMEGSMTVLPGAGH